VDGIFGAPVQNFFSLPLPLIGNVGPIDVLNYMIYAPGLKISKRGITAVIAAKLTSGLLPSLGPLNLGSFGPGGLNQTATNPSGSGQGAPL